MNRSFILAVAVTGAIAGMGAIADAQRAPQIKEGGNTAEQEAARVANLPAEEWIEVAKTIVNGNEVLGKPEVYMLNATQRDLTIVMCRTYQLVGPKPYIEGNAKVLPARTATKVSTKGFNSYCKDGVTAQDARGGIYKAAISSVDGSFDNANYITFWKAQ